MSNRSAVREPNYSALIRHTPYFTTWSEERDQPTEHAERLLCKVCAGPTDQAADGTLWLLKDHSDDWPGWPGTWASPTADLRVCPAACARLCERAPPQSEYVKPPSQAFADCSIAAAAQRPFP